MRRIALPLTLAGTFAVAALGTAAISGGSTGSARIVDVRHSTDDAQETPSPVETPDAPDDSDGRTSSPVETPSADDTLSPDDSPSASETPDAPDDSDGRVGGGHGGDDGPGDDRGGDDDDDSGPGGDDDRSGSNRGKG